ncbi:MAG: hypothetical protein H8D75_01600 [Rhodospirillaceae bacterium]|nr:hypothetical protein [Rhodospirillaceae bacterium]MBL6932130.1 hypothetical protein [Rhodospirillales bacterium]
MSELVIGFAGEQRRMDMRRVVEDTFVVIDGVTCKVMNISLRGFFCKGYKGSAREGDEIIIEDLLMADDSRIKVNAPGLIMRLDASKKEMAAVFVNMNEKTFNTLEKMMMLRPLAGDGGRLR